jgi:hypothetical protein
MVKSLIIHPGPMSSCKSLSISVFPALSALTSSAGPQHASGKETVKSFPGAPISTGLVGFDRFRSSLRLATLGGSSSNKRPVVTRSAPASGDHLRSLPSPNRKSSVINRPWPPVVSKRVRPKAAKNGQKWPSPPPFIPLGALATRGHFKASEYPDTGPMAGALLAAGANALLR